MSDTAVSVQFGADTSRLNASIAQARAQLSTFGSSASSAAKGGLSDLKSSLDSANTSSGSFLTSIRNIAITLAAATYTVRETSNGLASLTSTITAAGAATANFVDEQARMAASGIASAVTGSSRALLDIAEGYRLAQGAAARFTADNTGAMATVSQNIYAIDQAVQRSLANVQAWYRGIGIYNSGLIDVERQAAGAAIGFSKFSDAAKLGGLGNSTETLRALTGELTKVPGLSNDGAAAIQNLFVTIPNYSVAANQALVALVTQISATGEAAQANSKKLVDAFRDTQNGGTLAGDLVAALKTTDDMTAAALKLKGLFTDAGQATTFIQQVMKAISKSDDDSRDAMLAKLQAARQVPVFGDIMVSLLKSEVDVTNKITSNNKANLLILETALQAERGITAAKKEQADFQEQLNSAETASSKIESLEESKKKLESRVRKGASEDDDNPKLTQKQRDLIIRTVYGEAGGDGLADIEGVINVIRNRIDSGRTKQFGSGVEGVINRPSAFSVWNLGDAAGVGARALDPNSNAYKTIGDRVDKRWSDDPDKDPTSGATHYYNPSQANPNWAASMTNDRMIGQQRFGNPDGSPPVLSNSDNTKNLELIQQTNDALRQQNAIKAGGTPAELASLDIAQKNLTQSKDAVAEAQKLLAAKKQELADSAGGTPADRNKAALGVAQAEDGLREKRMAAIKAQSEVNAKSVQQGSQEELAIKNNTLAQELALYAEGSAAYNRILQEMMQNSKRVNDQEKADQAAAEDAKYQNTERRLKEEEAAIKESASLGHISRAEELMDLSANLQKQFDAERAYQQRKQEIYGLGTAQYRKASTDLAEIDEKQHAKQLAAVQNYQKQVEQTITSSFERVGSTVSSSLMSIIEQTGNWRDLLRNVAKSIVSMFLDAGVKMIADWGAQQATKVALAVLGETQITTATITGVAARTAAVAAGGAEQAAVMIGSVLKSIAASAAQAFAGVAAFLSPILGPAALGPAAGVEGAVLAAGAAIGSYAVGSWSLPSDQLAMVHKGEMIIPSAQAPWAQSLMANAAGGGGGPGNIGVGATFNISHTSYGSRSNAAIQAEAHVIIDAIHANMRSYPGKWKTTFNKHGL